MKYKTLSEKELPIIVEKYMDYYNNHEDGCWRLDKAYKRIHQIVTIEDSMCLIQYDNNDEITGFVIGYYKEYDDLKAYYLEEIVIFSEYQGKGYGTLLFAEVERIIRDNNAEHIELASVNDEHHLHFYKKSGLYSATNLIIMGKHLK